MTLSNEIALEKLRKYCAYQDRCHQEVRSKLLQLKVYGDDLEEIIATLIQEKFLDELRFAKSYVRGKFRMNKWGRVKILQGLKQKEISTFCIEKAMLEIGEDEYQSTLTGLLKMKLKQNMDWKEKQKVKASMMRKGYELELVSELIDSLA